MSNKSKMKVYYNSGCPVCKAGIEGQMTKQSVCDIQWNDIHQNNQWAADVNPDLEFVRERLHVVDENGKLQVGFDAFLAMWRNSPKEVWLSKILGVPVIKHICRFFYNVFAAALYKWNKSKKHW